MVMRGFSDAYGSWKMIWTSRRNALSFEPRRLTISRPSKKTSPPVGCSRRMMARPVVDLPQPDSPTSPRVSPFTTLNDTPSTAFTAPV